MSERRQVRQTLQIDFEPMAPPQSRSDQVTELHRVKLRLMSRSTTMGCVGESAAAAHQPPLTYAKR